MRRECHGHSERTATGLFQIGEQRINHLHDGPGRRADSGSAPGNAVQDVGGYGGDSGGSVADCFDHGTLCLPEYVDITGESWFPLTLTFFPLFCLFVFGATCGSCVGPIYQKASRERSSLGSELPRNRSNVRSNSQLSVTCTL